MNSLFGYGYVYGCCPRGFQLPTLIIQLCLWMLSTGLSFTITNNKLFDNLLLKLEFVSLLEILGLKDLQSVTVCGKKLYLNTLDLTVGGVKW